MRSTTSHAPSRAAHRSSATRDESPAEARLRSRRSLTDSAPVARKGSRGNLGSPGSDEPQIRKGPVALVEIEAVADEELVGDDEADVPDRQILDEAPVRPVEQRRRRERSGLAELERLDEVAECQARVDDVLDDDHVPALDLGVEIFEQPDARRAAELDLRAVAGQLDEVDAVHDRQRAREIREEDEARLERADEDRLATVVIARDLRPELGDARLDLLGGEIDLPDPRICVLYEAIGSLNRSARRSMSRL